MTSSKGPPKVQTRTTAPTLARDHANGALIKLMQAQQTKLNSNKAGSVPAGSGNQPQPTIPTTSKKSG